MTAFVKPTAWLFLGHAVNRQIPYPRLGTFSALCWALVCTIEKNSTARLGDGRKPVGRRDRENSYVVKEKDGEAEEGKAKPEQV